MQSVKHTFDQGSLVATQFPLSSYLRIAFWEMRRARVKQRVKILTSLLLHHNVQGILFPISIGSTRTAKEQVDKWYLHYIELMQYRKNPNYGKTKCFKCLLGTAREEAGICGN
jgi:hypothetical protein